MLEPRTWELSIIVALAGCSTAPQDAGDIPQIVYLGLSPSDGTTSVGAVPPAVSVTGLRFGKELDDPMVPELVGTLSLSTYPEGERVEGSVVAVLQTAPPRHVGLEFRPSAPLRDRWYSLRLRTIPSRVQPWTYALQRTLPDGSWEARFRVGSEPSMLAIDLCGKGGTEVFLAFSEAVRTPLPGPPITVTYVDGSPAPACDFSLPPRPDGVPPDRPLNPAASYQGLCKDLAATKLARFTLGEGMTTADGAPVPPATITIDQPSLPTSQPSCVRWFRSF